MILSGPVGKFGRGFPCHYPDREYRIGIALNEGIDCQEADISITSTVTREKRYKQKGRANRL